MIGFKNQNQNQNQNLKLQKYDHHLIESLLSQFQYINIPYLLCQDDLKNNRMTDKTKFQKIVVEKLQNSGFKELLDQKEHKEFIEIIAATYFSNQLDEAGMVEYLGDIVKEDTQRKVIASIIKNLHIDLKKNQEKIQQQQSTVAANKETKDEKAVIDKEPKKKVKADTPTPHQQRPNKDLKGQKEPKKQLGEGEQQQQGFVTEKKNLKHELESSGKTKCRFFPFCKNPQSCEFFHPTEKCQYFPNCRFGDNCLYVHEPCRYKEKCTKMNCGYAHPGKSNNFSNDLYIESSNNMMEMFMKSMMMGKNPTFGNNKMKKKRPHPQDQKDEDQNQSQQQ